VENPRIKAALGDENSASTNVRTNN